MRFDLRRLRFERLSREITQSKVAEALNISRSTYHKKEKGKLKIGVDEFARILDVLGIPPSEVPNFFVRDVPEREQRKEEYPNG